jgi:hypothetical protein
METMWIGGPYHASRLESAGGRTQVRLFEGGRRSGLFARLFEQI